MGERSGGDRQLRQTWLEGHSALISHKYKIAIGHGQEPSAPDTPSELAPPTGIDVQFFCIESDEFVVLTYAADHEEHAIAPECSDIASLTAAEREILSSVLQGESNAAIACARRTSRRTVVNQVGAIFRKLGVRSRRELYAWARNRVRQNEG